MIEAKKIVLGVTGSIAAFKAADLASRLTRQGASVNVVMTADALRFITPLAFKTLSRHPVVTDLYDEEEGWKPTHIRLADEADLLLIAPATANNMAKLACGIAGTGFASGSGYSASSVGSAPVDKPARERPSMVSLRRQRASRARSRPTATTM